MSEKKRYCANRGSGYCGECVSADLSDEIDALRAQVKELEGSVEALLAWWMLLAERHRDEAKSRAPRGEESNP